MTFRIRDVQVAEEIAAQAGSEDTPAFELSPIISPVIFGPQRPPLASSGYFPGTIGAGLAPVPLNTSQVGLFVSGTNTDTIVRVNRITIINETAGVLDYSIRRLDDASGFTLVNARPGYISAGNIVSGGVFRIIRSNTVAPQGLEQSEVVVQPTSLEHFDGPWILNNGAVIVAPAVVNTAVRIYMNYEAWPSIRQQPIPG